jgi:SAM-dependent methyltransferase
VEYGIAAERMGLYRDHILPRLAHWALSAAEVASERQRALDEVSGDVLELGIGSALNLRHYGAGVRRVVGVDPSRTAARLAGKAIRAAPFPVDIVAGTAEAFAVEPAGFDSVVATFTLCTIPDVAGALSMARRALAPGGRLYFLEHGLSDDPRTQKWQRRFEPMQKRLAGGCHLTRDPRALLEAAGFAIERVETHLMKGPRPWSFLYRGVAV